MSGPQSSRFPTITVTVRRSSPRCTSTATFAPGLLARTAFTRSSKDAIGPAPNRHTKHQSVPAAMAMFLPRRRPSPSPLASMPRGRHRSEAADVDHGHRVGRRLEDCPVGVGMDELGPVGGRASRRRKQERLQRFAQVREDPPNRPRLWWNAISRMSPPQFGHGSGNSSPTRAMSLAQAIREVSCVRGS